METKCILCDPTCSRTAKMLWLFPFSQPASILVDIAKQRTEGKRRRMWETGVNANRGVSTVQGDGARPFLPHWCRRHRSNQYTRIRARARKRGRRGVSAIKFPQPSLRVETNPLQREGKLLIGREGALGHNPAESCGLDAPT